MLLCADNLYRSFPNLYAIRGTPYRDVRRWIASLDAMRALGLGGLSVTMPGFQTHRVVQLVGLCGHRDPLRGFFVWPHQQGVGALAVHKVGQQWRGGQRECLCRRYGLLQSGDAVQVGVHRDDRIEQVGQEVPHDLLADGLTRLERDVLAHVGQVGRDQAHTGGAQLARGVGREQQGQGLGVRVVQAAGEHHRPALHRRLDAHQGLAVGKPVHRQLAGLAAEAAGEVVHEGALPGQAEDQHQYSSVTWMVVGWDSA